MGLAGDDRGRVPDSIDNLIIYLRAYVTPEGGGSNKHSYRKNAVSMSEEGLDGERSRIPPSDWVLVFDCETRTTPDQRLRFGGYQLRCRGHLVERGAFYEPATLYPDELPLLRNAIEREEPGPDGERIRLLTREQFVNDVFYRCGYAVGAQIVGFNLPFDLSRLAIGYVNARRRMLGGFSLRLSELSGHPPVAVKHLSQRAAFIQFTGSGRAKKAHSSDIGKDAPIDEEAETAIDRGYFVDVKTLAAAITSGSHSLASLSRLLDVLTKKSPSEEHGGPLSEDYIRYALSDVQATWECFEKLAERFTAFGLGRTGLNELYSEASLGKAYLKAMNIRPWRKAQPDFSAAIIGNILSAYFGGRAEVHIRRQIVPVIHCDFLSMYPTVCTLMGLWNFVRSTGVTYRDNTEQIRVLLETPKSELVASFRKQAAWAQLAVLVQVIPEDDLFPIRAKYTQTEPTTIGLNHLTSEEPLWFTLADVLVSKILTGKTPRVIQAICFDPLEMQYGLRPITIAGEIVDPAADDFYRRLIIHRSAIRSKARTATPNEKIALESDQLGIKILANSTSYGIFVELNVEDHDKPTSKIAYGARSQASKFKAKTSESPGAYFHPLLGTLITGAARFMLALAEHQVIEQGLDWAFCDTDSMAIANIKDLPPHEFKERALRVYEWFKELNPYGENKSILQLEKVNFPAGRDGDLDAIDPPLCLAISAKRYVLFNRAHDGPIIRKASGHGLGHLLAPYDEGADLRRERIGRIGVPLWQEDLWREIIRAAESDTPDETRFMTMKNFDVPAASPYAATTPELLKWFKGYNERQPDGRKIFPFGFLLSLQSKSKLDIAQSEPEALSNELWYRREPRPAAPYFSRADEARDQAFDRERDLPIPASWLKSHGRSLVRYHMHPESKFHGGEFEQRGPLRRRHVRAVGMQPIGKESDNIEENEFIGEVAGPVEYPLDSASAPKLAYFIIEMQSQADISDRALCDRAGVSHHTMTRLKTGEPVSVVSLFSLAGAVEELRREAENKISEDQVWLRKFNELRDLLGGRNKLARFLGVSPPYLGRILSRKKPMTAEILEKFKTATSGA